MEIGRETIIVCLSFPYTLSLAFVAVSSNRWDSATDLVQPLLLEGTVVIT